MKNTDVQHNVSLYSVVTFKEHGFTGNEIKGIVTSINGDEIIIVGDFNDQVWTMDVNNASVSSIFSGDKVKWRNY